MNSLLLSLYIGINIYFLVSGLRKEGGTYTFSFISGLTALVYLIPQAVSIVSSPGHFSDDAIARVLLMATLCSTMILLGRSFKIPRSWLSKSRYACYNYKLLATAGTCYIFAGLFFYAAAVALSGTNTLSGGGRTGITTILFFFGRLLNIGMPLTLIVYLKTRRLSFAGKAGLLLSYLFFLFIFIVSAKREFLIVLILSILIPAFFVMRKRVSRKVVVISIFAVSLFFNPYTVSSVRQSTDIRGDWTRFEDANYQQLYDTVQNIDLVGNLQQFYSEDGNLELRNAAASMDYVVSKSGYEWGLGYWDTLVFNWVPAQLLGSKFKDSLLYSKEASVYAGCKDYFEFNFSYSCRKGQTFTGYSDAFSQFDYLGCLVFFLASLFFNFLWRLSVENDDVFAQVGYTFLIVRAIHFITHGTMEFPGRLLFMFVFLLPVIWISKRRNQRGFRIPSFSEM